MKSILKKIIVMASLALSLISMPAHASTISTAFFALDTSLLSNLLAKEMCSCIYVTGADQRFGAQAALKKCLQRGNLPLSMGLLNLVVKKSVTIENDTVTVNPTLLAKIVSLGKDQTGSAHYDRKHPQFGCSLTF